MFTFYSTIVSVVCFWVAKLMVDTVFNVFFGELSAIPGPKFAAATRLIFIWHKIQGHGEVWRMELHRKYGDVVRVAPNEISFATGEVWKDIYGYAPGSQFAIMEKDQRFYGGHGGENSLITALDLDHSRQRKCFSPAFSDKALRSQEPLVQGYVDQLIQNIGATQPINFAKQYNFTTFDVMADLAFGEPLGCLKTSEYISWISMIFASLKVMNVVSEVNRYPSAMRLLKMMIPASLKEKQQQHVRFCIDRVEKRLSQQNPKPDIWHFVKAAEEKDLKLTKSEMYANAGVFMIAGTETTATLASALTYYLVSNPDKLQRLTQEIRGRFNSPANINAQETVSLIYFTACVYEAFRMHPPIPVGLPRIVPKGGAEIGGYKLPEGVTTYIHQLSICRNPNNFAEPDTYLPERWLSDSEKLELNNLSNFPPISIEDTRFAGDKRSCLQPFSIGPGNCIGQNLAWLEIRLIMTHVLWHFDLELYESSKGWDEQQVFHLWASKPLMIVAKPVSR